MAMISFTFLIIKNIFEEQTGYFCSLFLVDMFGGADIEQYEILKECYNLYQKIGGCPLVIKVYLEYNEFERCGEEIVCLCNRNENT